jgi:26S proteasome regulatory subunit N1
VEHSKFPEALGLSIRLGDPDLIRQDFNAPGNPCVCVSLRYFYTDTHAHSLMKRQLAFLLARAQVPIEWLQPPSDNADGDADVTFQDDLPEDLLECLSNSRLSTHFKEFGKELGVADAKSLEDVYKSHLENTSE